MAGVLTVEAAEIGHDAAATTRLFQRVLVATDTGAASHGAERGAIELAGRVGASLVAVSVIDPSHLRLPGGLFHTRVDQVRTQREVALGRFVGLALQQGIGAQFLIWEGLPGPSVIEAAEAEDADVIVVGSHARGSVGRRLLGSVSTYIVDRSKRWPVIVVCADQRLDDVWPLKRGDDLTQQARTKRHVRRGA